MPPHKVDVTREADVIEEILRIYGYNHVALRPHNSASFLARFPNPDPEIIRQNTARLLSGQGFSEIITNSITNCAVFRAGRRTQQRAGASCSTSIVPS